LLFSSLPPLLPRRSPLSTLFPYTTLFRSVIGCFPNAPRSRAHIHNVRIALHHSEIIDAPAHGRGANLPEFQALEFIGGIRLVGRCHLRNRRQRSERGRANQNRSKSTPNMLHFNPLKARPGMLL